MKTVAASVDATRMAGARLAAGARSGDCYALEGELGAGKTEFVRGFVASLDPHAVVRSPSFSILNIYKTERFPVFHFDFYRLRDPAELREIGFDEYAAGEGVCLIEWGTLFPNDLPSHTKIIKFRDVGGGVREIYLP
ncbi:MAG: tRNA (adenosine(37)-N6)-threonylcarbamoyltransferase complex ATPase subunit type 1 TsaE [Chitinispirillaceae bacterium]|jgi:tRNA threonylcarbamoyladenosine biosynthesis protein TsaE